MATLGIKDAAQRLRELVDRGVPASGGHSLVAGFDCDVIEARLAEQATAIQELRREIESLAELIRADQRVPPMRKGSAFSSRRSSRIARALLATAAAVVAFAAWAWASGDLRPVIERTVELTGGLLGS
jgi:hypothetical protein